ncbi:hypothetical protein T484DRAFT_1776186 [Baffinella frigidus]|nr:hypothetical protein T484DRAFT_1776186 [Cryptophyta sp. CCMP2293]
MSSIILQLGSTKLTRSKRINPQHPAMVSFGSLVGAGRHEIMIEVEAKSLWDPIDLVAAAISVPEIELSGFEESPLVSPIVRIFNERVMFRNAVTVSIPHHSSNYESLAMVECSLADPHDPLAAADPYAALSDNAPSPTWEPVAGSTVTRTHVSARFDTFSGPLAVVSMALKPLKDSGLGVDTFSGPLAVVSMALKPLNDSLRVYVILEHPDGRLLSEVTMSIGESRLAQIEIIPCALVHPTALPEASLLEIADFLSTQKLASNKCGKLASIKRGISLSVPPYADAAHKEDDLPGHAL